MRKFGEMLLVGLCLFGLAALGNSTAPGQDTTSRPLDPYELLQRVATQTTNLEKRIQALENQLNQYEETFVQLDQNLRNLATQVNQINGNVSAQYRDIETLANRIGKLEVQNPYPFKPTVGRLVVQNYTSVLQTLRVNGKDYLIPPGETIIPWIGVRDLEAYLPYQESRKVYPPEMWRLVSGQYEFTLHIRPKQQVTVLSQ